MTVQRLRLTIRIAFSVKASVADHALVAGFNPLVKAAVDGSHL